MFFNARKGIDLLNKYLVRSFQVFTKLNWLRPFPLYIRQLQDVESLAV